jgi:hypothetical protein
MYLRNDNINSRKYIYTPMYNSILALLRRKTLIIFRVLHFQNIPIFIMHSLS